VHTPLDWEEEGGGEGEEGDDGIFAVFDGHQGGEGGREGGREGGKESQQPPWLFARQAEVLEIILCIYPSLFPPSLPPSLPSPSFSPLRHLVCHFCG
jgi:hypothetical protein